MTAIPPLAFPAHKFAVPIYLIARQPKGPPDHAKERTGFADNVSRRPDEPFWGTIAAMVEERHTRRLEEYLHVIEIGIYYILALLLAVTALAAIGSAGQTLWNGLIHWTIAAETLHVLDELLIVLMIVEIFHTVRIAIHSHFLLATEPFLVVGVIASIRRVLVISLQMSALTTAGKWTPDGASIFRASMLELGLLIILVLVLVICITLLRRYAPAAKEIDGEVA